MSTSTVSASGPRGIVLTPPSFDLPPTPHETAGWWTHVVLVAPEIPQNTGNIARLCAGTRTWLHLVKPFGFVLEDRYLKRAGLDYWPSVRLSVHEDLAQCEVMLPRDRTYLYTKRASKIHRDPSYGYGAVLVFGRESTGLPADFVARWEDRTVRIPMTGELRSLNLGNAVSIAVYETLSQQGWRGEEPAPSA